MAYGVRYRGEWRSPMRSKKSYVVEIAEDGYTGTAVKPLLFTGDVITITYGERDESELHPIKSSECELTFLCTEDGNPYAELYTLSPTRYKLTVSENSGEQMSIRWQGYLATGEYQQPVAAPPYSVRIRANDGLLVLKTIDYLNEGNRYNDTLSVSALIDRLLSPISPTQLANIWGYTHVAHEQQRSTFDIVGISDNSIYEVFTDGIPTYYDVLVAVLECFGIQLFQENGGWSIRSLDRLAIAVNSSLITPIDLNSTQDGLGLSSSSILTIKAPIAKVVGNAQDDISKDLPSLCYDTAWQKIHLVTESVTYPKPTVSPYSRDSLIMQLSKTGNLYGVSSALVYALKDVIHHSEKMEVTISFDLSNISNKDVSVGIAAWLVDSSIGDRQLFSLEPGPNADIYYRLEAPAIYYYEAGAKWSRVPESYVTFPGIKSVKLSAAQDKGMRPALSSLEKQNVTLTIPGIPEVLVGDHYVRDWRIAVVIVSEQVGRQAFILSSPKVSVTSGKEESGTREVIISESGDETISVNERWRVGSDTIATALVPQLLNMQTNKALYGYFVPSPNNSSIANKAAIVQSLREAPTFNIEGEIDKRGDISLNNVWSFDGKYYYASYLKQSLRREVIEAQLAELYALNTRMYSKLLAIGTQPVNNPKIAVTQLYYLVKSTLYAIDTKEMTSKIVANVALDTIIVQGVECVVISEKIDSSVMATAYGDDGEVLSSIIRDDDDTIPADPWWKTIVFDARNKVWLATNKVGTAVVYDIDGFVLDSTLIVSNGTNCNILPYGDGYIYTAEIAGGMSADWHSFSIHKRGQFSPLTGRQPHVVAANDAAIVSYDSTLSQYIVYFREGADLNAGDRTLYLPVDSVFIAMNCALIVLQNTGGLVVYDMRVGDYASVNSRAPRYAALSGDKLCLFGVGIAANNFITERVISKINNLIE